jgi:hypothetical protein
MVDCFVFFGNLYTEASKDSLNDKYSRKFSREGLQLFDETLDDIIWDLEQKKTKMLKNKEDISLIQSASGGLIMEMTGVTIILQTKFDIIGEVAKLIFDNKSEGKFVYNPYTKKSQISPLFLKKINEFNVLKKLIVKTANQKRGIVNVSLVKSFVQQVKLKTYMLMIQKKHGLIKLDKTEDEIFQDVLYELIICRPNEFETTLVNDSEILIFSESKINKVQNLVQSCKARVTKLENQMIVKDKKQNIQ